MFISAACVQIDICTWIYGSNSNFVLGSDDQAILADHSQGEGGAGGKQKRDKAE